MYRDKRPKGAKAEGWRLGEKGEVGKADTEDERTRGQVGEINQIKHAWALK